MKLKCVFLMWFDILKTIDVMRVARIEIYSFVYCFSIGNSMSEFDTPRFLSPAAHFLPAASTKEYSLLALSRSGQFIAGVARLFLGEKRKARSDKKKESFPGAKKESRKSVICCSDTTSSPAQTLSPWKFLRLGCC